MSVLLAALMAQPSTFAASHREAPITALDQKADITDWFAFVSPEHPDKVIMILNVDPFLEPSNGPNYFPFDPGILYEMKVDWNNDGLEDVKFQFRFQTQIQNPALFTGFVGGIAGIPPITALEGPGAAGLNLSQTYNVKMVTEFQETDLGMGQTLFAVPTNVGPKTMPNYAALRQQGVYNLADNVRVFAGTVADPFYIDLGATFDSINYRMAAGGGVLSTAHRPGRSTQLRSQQPVGFQREHHRAGSSHHHVDARPSAACGRRQSRGDRHVGQHLPPQDQRSSRWRGDRFGRVGAGAAPWGIR